MRAMYAFAVLGVTVSTALAATQYQYDALSRLKRTDYADGRSVSYHYDPQGNLVACAVVALVNNRGVTDAWEIQYFGQTNRITAVSDYDHDGLSDVQEFMAGTNPTNATSCLNMSGGSSAGVSNGVFQVEWQSVADKFYLIERSANLLANPAFVAVARDIRGLAGTTRWTDTAPSRGSVAYYRITLEP